MAQTSPTRRVLSEICVNKLGTSPKSHHRRKEAARLKRPLLEVDDTENARPSSRVKILSASTHETPNERTPAPSAQATAPLTKDTCEISTSTKSDSQAPPAPIEEAEDPPSPHSCKDLMSSTPSSDPDETMASQQTAATELTQPVPSRTSLRAETLRLRLQLAHFKVKTNQTSIPLSQLRTSTSTPPSTTITEEPPLPPSPSNPSQPPPEHSQPSLPTLLPAPILRPTAYSSRTISYSHQIPSSPPGSPDEDRGDDDEVFRTPALPRTQPAWSAARGTSSRRKRVGEGYLDGEEGDLTSSAVRGKAAIGLLGLARERLLER